jgi:hypothetical protein
MNIIFNCIFCVLEFSLLIRILHCRNLFLVGVEPALVEAIWLEAARMLLEGEGARLAAHLAQKAGEKGQALLHEFGIM